MGNPQTLNPPKAPGHHLGPHPRPHPASQPRPGPTQPPLPLAPARACVSPSPAPTPSPSPITKIRFQKENLVKTFRSKLSVKTFGQPGPGQQARLSPTQPPHPPAHQSQNMVRKRKRFRSKRFGQNVSVKTFRSERFGQNVSVRTFRSKLIGTQTLNNFYKP